MLRMMGGSPDQSHDHGGMTTGPMTTGQTTTASIST